MNASQTAIFVWMLLSLSWSVWSLHDHGKTTERKNNFFVVLIIFALNAWILHKGGFL